MIQEWIEEMHGSDRESWPETITERAFGWHGTSSNRAKWRTLSSARWSTLKKDLTQSDIVRDAIFQQLSRLDTHADTLKRKDTLMEQANSNKRAIGRVMFRTVGLCAVLLFLLWNPLVLRPRFWNATVVGRSLAIDTALLVIGVGLIRLRRWAALLASVLAAYVAIDFANSGGSLGVPLTLSFLTPLPLTLVFWRDLVWGDKRRDLLLALASLMVSALFHYAAFVIQHA